MSLRSLARAWNGFFFRPQSPVPIALFRIVYGLLVIADLLLLRGDWQNWFGAHSFVSMETMRRMAAGPRINLFVWIAHSDFWIEALFWLALVAAVCLTIGLLTRASSVAVFVAIASLHQRNLFILHSGDTLMRVTGFFLMFAPAGAAFSVDRLIRIWKGKEGLEIQPRAPWAQRMIQIQVALAYFVTFYIKSQGRSWIGGTAIYYVLRLDEFRHFPLPAFFQDPLIVRLATWGTLAVEFALGALVWFKELRYWVLLAGLLLHLSLEYSMNVPLFQWMIVATYITFVEPEDLARFWERVRAWAAPHLGDPVTLIFDSASPRAVRAARVLQAIDVFERLRPADLHSRDTRAWVSAAEGRGRILVGTPAGARAGLSGLRFAARALPLFWPLALTRLWDAVPRTVAQSTE